jgi:hypothetical protein
VVFNDCHILCIELPDDGPYVTETCIVWKYSFVVSTVFWLIILYVNMEVDESTVLEAIARHSKDTEDWEGLVCAVVNCNVCELVIEL